MPQADLGPPDDMTCDFGVAGSSSGDLNADGFADLVVSGDRYQPPASGGPYGLVYVYLGGPGGVSTSHPQTLGRPEVMLNSLGETLSGAGDVNGDGFADVVITAPRVTEEQVLIFHGNASGLSADSPTVLVWPDRMDEPYATTGDFGISVAMVRAWLNFAVLDAVQSCPHHAILSQGMDLL
jgi:hypothetical protein